MYGALESVAVLWRLRSYRDIIIIIIIISHNVPWLTNSQIEMFLVDADALSVEF